jgi:hypothetical protein
MFDEHVFVFVSQRIGISYKEIKKSQHRDDSITACDFFQCFENKVSGDHKVFLYAALTL